MPFGKYKNFMECVRDFRNKGNSPDRAASICAGLHKKITGKWPGELVKMEEENLFGLDISDKKSVDLCNELDKLCNSDSSVTVTDDDFEDKPHVDQRR